MAVQIPSGIQHTLAIVERFSHPPLQLALVVFGGIIYSIPFIGILKLISIFTHEKVFTYKSRRSSCSCVWS